ncbi:NUDIX hydrolase [Streptomyces sp. NPDC006458]|uniref:NUDIX hydrolase n=1 Tax=Streptomyces sp. NPDC006458 TaxID=3154302 RepID=UPI0033B95945
MSEETRDASVILARDANGHVAVLSAQFPRHGGEYLFLPGGRFEADETPVDCARRELKEEAGVTARTWRSLGTYAITLASPAKVHLWEATDLTLGPQRLTETEQDFKLMWWPVDDAVQAVREGRFLLPAGPLALLLSARSSSPLAQGTVVPGAVTGGVAR